MSCKRCGQSIVDITWYPYCCYYCKSRHYYESWRKIMLDLSTLFCNTCYIPLIRQKWNLRFCSPDCVVVHEFRQELKAW